MLSFTFLLASSLVATRAFAAFPIRNPKCPDPHDEMPGIMAAHEELAIMEKNSTIKYAAIHVDVYAHVIMSSKPNDENITVGTPCLEIFKAKLADNLANISFTLQDATWVTRDDWGDGSLDKTPAMDIRRSLHRGGPGTLNLYFASEIHFSGVGLDGAGTVPSNLQTDRALLDGCVISKWAVRNQRLMTHEVGHWFGLLHTWEDICNYVGDFIDDTLPSPTICHTNPSDCPNEDNFMSYGDYTSSFSPGQLVRLPGLWAKFRSGANPPRYIKMEKKRIGASSPAALQTDVERLPAPAGFSCGN
ncbi:peptidase M43 family protein [Metarhizium robertsii]|uniref:Metalloprotease 1 n=2 Tax=Metarhizium robertsii TaxID=568076 RepID=E9ENJ6_METRA|nr:metalloprotease 1 [Metarhizium robertsii ARSEF 23]EFZ04208.1 metalloprotease 1 [Metarhizium robertsii ARSEF 23]EXU94619.1 peptidase M43 family protein [Metarhizium robertsii]